MTLDEIAQAHVTLSLDPDEARVLAAACVVAGSYLLDSVPVVNPFDGMGDKERLSMLVEAYGALFEAGGMAAYHEDNYVRKEGHEKEFLSGLRKYGTGFRFPLRTESEAGDAV